MPHLNTQRVTNLIRRNKKFRGDVRLLAEATGVPYGTLRNAVAGHDGMRYYRISLLAEALGVPDDKVKDLIRATGIPDEPPEQPKNEPKAPPKRKDVKKKAPRRDASDRMRVAS
jgi:hypothetical protein